MSQVNQARLAAGFAKQAFPVETASVEENDVNININAETEGGEVSAPEVAEAEPAVIDTEVEADVDDVPFDTTETPEASELEVQEVQGEADETVDEIEELDNTLDSLESIYFTLANVAAEGMEITPAFARLTQVAVANAVGRFGLTPADCGVASVESIELAPAAQIEASMEGILDTVKQGGKQIAEQMKKLIQFLADFLKSIYTYRGRVNKQIENAEKALRGFKGEFNGSVILPAVLEGKYKASDLNQAAKTAKDVLSAKYADIAVLAKSAEITDEAIKNAFTKANAGTARISGNLIPGINVAVAPTGALAVVRTAKSGEATISQSEAGGILAAAKALLAASDAYDAGKGTRKQVSEAVAGSKAANRKLAATWSKQATMETKVASHCVALAGGASQVVLQALRGKKAEKAEA